MGRAHRWWRHSPHPPKAGIADSSETHRRSEAGRAACDVSAHAGRARKAAASTGTKAGWPETATTRRAHRPAAASVDGQLADRIGSCGWRAIEFAVAQAIASHDPHLLETREKQGRDALGVRLFHRGVDTGGADDWVGTSHLEVTGDTLDLTTFHDLVCDQAAQLKALGDTDTLEVRKAKAVGVIANRQATPAESGIADSLHTHRSERSGEGGLRRVGARGQGRRWYLPWPNGVACSGSKTPTAPPAATGPGSGPWRGSGRPPSPGSRTGPAGPGSPSNPSSTCAAPTPSTPTTHPPGCGNSSSSATGTAFSRLQPGRQSLRLDHITPYEENGPPGQTRPDALAALCRRHHRAKTFRRWRYHRTPSGAYQWTGPQGQHFLVTPTGTIPIPPN